ncbi:MAG: hypothetical protein K2G51_16295 [Lachnospiraceae bacterium]|nr:hypothetical protein [Lachnospiraceae bacterium]MDE7274830.1 hypothetical protein [Lachnospiraceae bacterium]
MEYRQKYENLLQTLCNAYNKMFQLLECVEQCDRELARLSQVNRPSVEEVCRVTEYKERLITTLDQISIAIDPIHDQLDGIRALCQEIDQHSMYLHLTDLQLLVYYYIRQVINKEDIRNPDIIRRLNDYKESLELDKALSEVPESERQVFMLVPEKKK